MTEAARRRSSRRVAAEHPRQHGGAIKVIDFGVAKATNRLAPQTRSGIIKGKLQYMAPEQALGKPLDRRVDIWALGVWPLRARLDKLPYDGDNQLRDSAEAQRGDAAPARSAVPTVVEDILMKALARRPEDRYATASAMRRAIEQALVELELPHGNDDLAAFVEEHMRIARRNARDRFARAERSGRKVAVVDRDRRAGSQRGAFDGTVQVDIGPEALRRERGADAGERTKARAAHDRKRRHGRAGRALDSVQRDARIGAVVESKRDLLRAIAGRRALVRRESDPGLVEESPRWQTSPNSGSVAVGFPQPRASAATARRSERIFDAAGGLLDDSRERPSTGLLIVSLPARARSRSIAPDRSPTRLSVGDRAQEIALALDDAADPSVALDGIERSSGSSMSSFSIVSCARFRPLTRVGAALGGGALPVPMSTCTSVERARAVILLDDRDRRRRPFAASFSARETISCVSPRDPACALRRTPRDRRSREGAPARRALARSRVASPTPSRSDPPGDARALHQDVLDDRRHRAFDGGGGVAR